METGSGPSFFQYCKSSIHKIDIRLIPFPRIFWRNNETWCDWCRQVRSLLCTAVCEDAGHDVIVSDINSKYISGLTNKEIYTNEPEVEDMLMRTTKLTATTSNSEVIKRSDVIFTFVPTPSLEDGSYDCSYVDDVLEDLINFPNLEGKIFVIGCTTNPGYSDKFAE